MALSAENAHGKGGYPGLPLPYCPASSTGHLIIMHACEREMDAEEAEDEVERIKDALQGGGADYVWACCVLTATMRCYVTSKRPRRRKVAEGGEVVYG